MSQAFFLRPFLRVTLLGILGLGGVGLGQAQLGGVTPPPTDVDATLRTLVPDKLVLSRPATANAISFDLGKNFPPARFPAQFPARPQEFQVFSSSARPWTVQMEVRAQPDRAGRVIPVRQLRYRVNDGPWLDVTQTPQVVQSGVGPTPGWLPLKVEFELTLLGSEQAGEYDFDVAFTALALP